jgi:hypothetical protein
VELLSQEIRNYQKKTSKLNHELDVIKTDFEKEKKELKKTISELRQELHRTAPIHDHKFFSLSEELKTAITDIETSINTPINFEVPVAITPGSSLPVNLTPTSPLAFPTAISPATPMAVITSAANTPTAVKPKGKDRKLLFTGIILLFLLVSGAVVSYQIMKKPKIDAKLVDKYLNSGQIQGAQTSESNEPKVDRYAELPIDQTKWQGFEDPFYGIKFLYPANVAEKQKNGNGIALLRKDGYLFKFQQIPTKLSLKEYWDQNQNKEIKYQQENINFQGKPALKLTTTDESDYPGEKYLVKNGEAILDLWFPVASDKYSADDLERVKKLKDSIIFF